MTTEMWWPDDDDDVMFILHVHDGKVDVVFPTEDETDAE